MIPLDEYIIGRKYGYSEIEVSEVSGGKYSVKLNNGKSVWYNMGYLIKNLAEYDGNFRELLRNNYPEELI